MVLTTTCDSTQVPVAAVTIILACPDVSSISENWCIGEGGAKGDCGRCVPGSRLTAALIGGLGTSIPCILIAISSRLALFLCQRCCCSQALNVTMHIKEPV